jgi:hypothetical protein
MIAFRQRDHLSTKIDLLSNIGGGSLCPPEVRRQLWSDTGSRVRNARPLRAGERHLVQIEW